MGRRVLTSSLLVVLIFSGILLATIFSSSFFPTSKPTSPGPTGQSSVSQPSSSSNLTSNPTSWMVNIQASLPTGPFAVNGSLNPVSSNYVRVTNGNSSVSVVDVALTYDNQTFFAHPTGLRVVSPGSVLYLLISSLPVPTSSGSPFSGYVLLSNGMQVVFSSTFS